jgi:hypothetical protein
MNEEQYDRLVGEIYQAALDIRLWQPLMLRISDLIPAVGGHFFVMDTQRGRYGVFGHHTACNGQRSRVRRSLSCH